ncbi:MAG: zinc ribbon domain-containing protein [Hydrogenoanaerobacterium sp.]
MKFCPYCGEPLPQENVKFCPECGEKLAQIKAPNSEPSPLFRQAQTQEQEILQKALALSAQSSDTNNAENYYKSSASDYSSESDYEYDEDEIPQTKVKKRGIGVGKVIIIMVITAILLALCAGYVIMKLTAKKAPEKAVDDFISAVSAGDTQYVLRHIKSTDGKNINTESAKKLCTDMTENMNMTAFRGHLLSKIGYGDADADALYSAFNFVQTENSLLSQSFTVELANIKVLVHTAVPDAELYVDDKLVKAVPDESGSISLSLLPGRHSICAVYTGYGAEYELGKADVVSFSANEQAEASVSDKLASAEIELSGLENNLQVIINGNPVKTDTTGGFIVLNPVFSGMELTVKCDEYSEKFTMGGGVSQQYKVSYIAKREEEQDKEGDTPVGKMTNRQLIETLAPQFYAYYRSYLEAINVWDATIIHGVSDEYRAEVIKKMEDYNQGLMFNFNEMTVDRRSVVRETKDGEFYVKFNVYADFNYAKKGKEENWLAGGNYQVVTMHYNKDILGWEVSGISVKDNLKLSDDVFTIKP